MKTIMVIILVIVALSSTPIYAADWGIAAGAFADGFSKGLQNAQTIEQIRLMQEQRRMQEQQRLMMEQEQKRMEQEERRIERQRQIQLTSPSSENCEEKCSSMYIRQELKSGLSIEDCVRYMCR